MKTIFFLTLVTILATELKWSWQILSFLEIWSEFFPDLARVLSFSEFEFFSKCPKISPDIMLPTFVELSRFVVVTF